MRRTITGIIPVALLVAVSCGQPAKQAAPEVEEPAPPETVAEPEVEVEAGPAGEEAAEDVGEEPGQEVEAAPAQERGPESITLAAKAKLGQVTFPHAPHQEHLDCATCHHTMEPSTTPEACHACHGQDADAPAAKDALHKTCQGCHKEMAKGPHKKCNECHKK